MRATALAVLHWRAASLPDLAVELCRNARLLRELLGGMDEGVQANALAILASLLPKLDAHAVGGALGSCCRENMCSLVTVGVQFICLLSVPSFDIHFPYICSSRCTARAAPVCDTRTGHGSCDYDQDYD